MRLCLLADAQSIHTKRWVAYFVDKGHQVGVISFREGSIDGAEVYNVGLRFPLSGKSGYLFALLKIKSRIEVMNPDLIHAHHLTSYGFLAALTGFHPLIVSAWGSDILVSPKQQPLFKPILKYALKKADVVTVTSNVLSREIKKYCTKDVSVIPFGVDTDQFVKRDGDTSKRCFTIGAVKALTENSGIKYLIEAFVLVKQQFSDVRLHLVGTGPEEVRLKKLVHDLDLVADVSFLGHVPHEKMPEHLNKMDLLAIPSMSESFGVAALEAAACELPVIASNIGGLPEVVIDGETGFLVPSKDPNAIAEKMVLLMQEIELRKRMGEAARRFVEQNYVWEENAKEMERLYLRAAKKRG